jgi:hypothetical protein
MFPGNGLGANESGICFICRSPQSASLRLKRRHGRFHSSLCFEMGGYFADGI